MIISVEKAKTLLDLKGWTDEKIEMKLKAIEQVIRKYTNNNFQDRGYRTKADIFDGELFTTFDAPFVVGDTIQITESTYNGGVYTVTETDGTTFTVSDDTLKDEECVLVTKIVYPADVIDCCVNLLEWEKNNRAKVGIKSETLSRHSVTYFDQDSSNQVMGYPVSLLGCLRAYRKARC